MSYTKHTWTDNETITAAKLNNIEDGIEEAAQSGGGGNAILILNTHYLGTATNQIGALVYLFQDDGDWVCYDDFCYNNNGIIFTGNATNVVASLPLLPDDTGIKVAWVTAQGYLTSPMDATFDGDIDSTPTTCYVLGTAQDAYFITGVASVLVEYND